MYQNNFRLRTPRFVFLTLLMGILPATSLAGDSIEVRPEPPARAQFEDEIGDALRMKPESSTDSPSPLSHSFTVDFVKTTNKMLLQQEQAPLNNHEVLELSKITENWANPIQLSVFLYLCVFGFIVGHSIVKKHYKWSIPMLLIGAFLPALVWIAPVSYTRRHLFTESFSQQIPMVLLQILPTFVWWAALADLAQWYERIIRIRGL